MAANLMLTYKLKPGVSPADFENWVRTTDYPAMRGLKRVRSFTTYRATGLLMGEGSPLMDYMEVFEIPDFAGFMQEDMASPTVQNIMGQFMGFAEAPQFVLVDEVR